MRILSLVCLLFLAGAAPGAPPRKTESPPLRVEGETVLIVSKLPFRVVCDAPADLYFWRLPPGWKGIDTGKELTVTEAPQGAATVTVQTLRIDWEAKRTVTAGHTLAVNVGVGPVPPGPTPPPIPPGPGPLPPVTKAWVVVVEETADAWNNRGAYYADAALSGYIRTKGWKLRVSDKDARDAAGQPPRDLAPYFKLAAGKPLPWLFVVDSTGSVRVSQALPGAPAELVAILRKIGG